MQPTQAREHVEEALPQNVQMEFRWTLGHRNIEGDEQADQLAKKVSKRTNKDPQTFTSTNYLKKNIKDKARTEWKEKGERMRKDRATAALPTTLLLLL